MKSWKKCLAALLACAVLTGGTSSAFALVAQEQLFYEAGLYTGMLYFCDSDRQTVVLTDVTPVAAEPTEQEKATALAAEYEELALSPFGLRLQDGSPLVTEDLNAYVDSKVQVVIVRSASGLRVLGLNFL